MAELLSPAIFIEERTASVQQINAVSTSNYASLGYTLKGPEDVATLVTSLEQFFNTFGGFTKEADVHYGMVGFFQNGGARAYFVRIAPDDAIAATGSLEGEWKFDANSRGAWGNNLKVRVSGNPNYRDSATASYSRFDVSVLEESSDGEDDFVVQETFEALSLDDGDDADYIEKVLNDEFNGSNLLLASELSAGIPATLESTEHLNESVGTGDGLAQTFATTLANPEVAEDTLKIKQNGTLVAIDDGEGALSGTGISGSIDYETGAVSVFFSSAPAGSDAITADYYQEGAESAEIDLAGGSDGTPSTIDRDNISASSLIADKRGIYAFDDIDEFLNMGLPDYSGDKTISVDLIAYAEERKDVFVILDAGEGKTAQQAQKYKRNTLGSNSEYAAMYWPRIKVADELNNGIPKVVSPVGQIAGVYARTDTEKNVGKSPGGVDDGQLVGILELEVRNSQGERDILYPAGINPLREDSFVGRAVWGVKTLAITGDFTRINARRLFIFLEKSVFNSTHDLVFENIGSQLYARIKLRLDGFFTVLFEDGYFRGDTPEQAFQVIVDESNNPPEVVNQRQVIIDVFIAVNEPAEFIRFRFQRKFD